MTPAHRVLTLFTIGHSTLTADAFLALLRAHGVAQVADVRTVPRSRRHPHFERAALEAALGAEGIGYWHVPELGGLRHPRPDSINTAWQNPSFRGYADHMQSDAFARALGDLVTYAGARPTAVMCAEAVWWRCHRALLADALTARSVKVLHILSPAVPKPHTLTQFARIEDGRVTYPGLL